MSQSESVLLTNLDCSRPNSNYETPLIAIFKLLEGDTTLSKIFVDLLPDLFVTRMFVSS